MSIIMIYAKNFNGILFFLFFILQIRISDVRTFPLCFWLVSIVCVTYYVATIPFISFAQTFFKNPYGFAFDDTKASIIQSKFPEIGI